LELNVLKKDAKERSDAVKYIDSLLNEYARAFHSRLTFVEEPRFKSLFDALDKAAANPDLAPAEKFTQRAVLLTAPLKRTETAWGGELLEGKALDKQGRLQQGKVALIGPVAMFASSAGETVGVLQQELNKADPTVVEVDRSQNAATRELTSTGKGQLVLDPTLGNAFRLSALHESLYHRLAQGGLIMIPLLSLGAASVLLALVKWVQLSRVRLATDRDLQLVLRHLESREQTKA